MHDPRAILGERLAARRASVAALERRDARLAAGRLAAFVAAALAVALALARRASPAWIAVPGIAYVALAVVHDKALKALARARRAVRFHEDGLARLDLAFAGRGDAGERYAREDHPYALDLDLFGKGTLFELICAARTRAGADALARLLLEPGGGAEDVRARQAAVAELSPRLDLREDLTVLGEDVRAEVDAGRLAAWGAAPRALPAWPAPVAMALGIASVATLVAWFAGALPGWWFAAAVAANWALLRVLRDRIAHVLGGVERPAAELEVLAAVLARLEREPFAAPLLVGVRAPLLAGGGAASRRIAALARAVERAAQAHNQFLAPVAFLVLWRVHAALAVERWRARHGGALAGWLAAVADLEALASLAGHAFLHPEDPFPEVEDGRGATYDGEALGHPLLPEARSVRNDVRLGGAGAALLVVSGSNMSGKSTLLRTVGANAVLALAGAPVRARRLVLSPLRIGATLRIQDSLAEGRSRFFAEITRLRQILDLAAGGAPALFLLDELLAGTNSRDRRAGGEAILRGLLARGAIGLVTTHDLALAELADAVASAANAHFEDELRGGDVSFDYKLKPGVVTRSNALALMRAVGLEV